MIPSISIETIPTSHGSFTNNTYAVVSNTGSCVLIDPSWEKDKYLSFIESNKLSCSGIFITHYHYDHINLANTLSQQLDSPVYFSRIESKYYNIKLKNVILLNPHDTVSFSDILIEAIHTPGHTYGGYCYYIDNKLFTGDTLFNEGCGNCVDKGSDASELFYSIQKIKKLTNSSSQIYSGHSYGSPPGLSMQDLYRKNIYINIDDIEIFTKFRMRRAS